MENLKQLTLLYVEDEVETLEFYSRYFKDIFKTVYTSFDGLDGYDKYKQYKPEVLVLDIDIPFKSGLEVAKEIRDIDKDVKIIMLTGQDDKDTLLQAIELNLVTYLEKPVTRKNIKDALLKLSKQVKEKIENDFIYLSKEEPFYVWDNTTKNLYKDNELIKLTAKETKLFDLLVKRKNQVSSYEYIYDNVWIEDSYKEFSIPAIKTLIKKLRTKLPQNSIVSSYGKGFFLKI